MWESNKNTVFDSLWVRRRRRRRRRRRNAGTALNKTPTGMYLPWWYSFFHEDYIEKI
jgi:hypothetical protein